MHTTTLTLNLSRGIFTRTWNSLNHDSPFCIRWVPGAPSTERCCILTIPQKDSVFEGLKIGAKDKRLNLTIKISKVRLSAYNAKLYIEDAELYDGETRVLEGSAVIIPEALLESGWEQVFK